jgi:hypothetical protein
MLAMMRERGYVVNKRNREMERDAGGDSEPLGKDEDWVMLRDFETGEMKRVRRIKSGRI